VANHQVAEGRFFGHIDFRDKENVAVLGASTANQLFPFENPLGAIVKVGSEYFRIVGVMEEKTIETSPGEGQSAMSSNYLFIPISTARIWFGEYNTKVSSGSREMERVELHELQVRVRSTDLVVPTAHAVRAMLDMFHEDDDVKVIVPLELLEQARQTKRIFNIVLGSIAGISLLVGGIGIMNIMLATVTERTREIGIRRALGAKRNQVITQFIVETMVLSVTGGLLGIVLGVVAPKIVERFAEMKTIITAPSLVLAFGISAAVGIIFGLYPAWRAANMDPIEALRHE
jgi:putative ABC transport system permease protein